MTSAMKTRHAEAPLAKKKVGCNNHVFYECRLVKCRSGLWALQMKVGNHEMSDLESVIGHQRI